MSAITDRYIFSGAGEDFGPKKGSGLITLHTFEQSDPTKNTMHYARIGAAWQDRHDVLGAYNRIIATDGVLGCVPDGNISGGMAAGTSVYNPLAWVRALFPWSVIGDGNSYSQQLCFMTARWYSDANGWDPGFIDGAARSIIDEEERTGRTLGVDLFLTNHSDFQPGNRSDAGPIATALVLERYAQLKAPPQEDHLMTRTWRPRTETWTTVPEAPFYTAGLTKYWGLGVEVTTFLEEIVMVDGVLTTPKSRLLVANYPDPIAGPEVLLIPRTSLTAPRDGANGLPTIEVETVIDASPAQLEAAANGARDALNQNVDAWVATRPRQ